MQQKLRVLLADDDPVFLRLLPTQLASKNLEISTTDTGGSVIDVLKKREFDVVILDVDLPDVSGLEVLEKILKNEPSPEVIMLTGDTSLETGLKAMRLGAYDYITKPADPEMVHAVIQKAVEKTSLKRQNERLRVAAAPGSFGVEPVFASKVSIKLFEDARRAAELDTTILITGESGTGKDVLANWIHSGSQRSGLPLVSVNCGAIPENLVESEFFGFEKGAFTGAASQKIGLIEAADSSTLFLDEIGEMPLTLQVKLLRFLENGNFRRVGSVKDQNSDARIIAATNKELAAGINDGTFRSDLFYRLNVISFEIPPLRERIEDIAALVDHFMQRFRTKYGRPSLELSDSAYSQLKTYDWPGNVRELKNTLERTVALTRTDLIEKIPNLDNSFPEDSNETFHQIETLAKLEKRHILRVLESVDGKREAAAAILGITARTLYRKLRQYNA